MTKKETKKTTETAPTRKGTIEKLKQTPTTTTKFIGDLVSPTMSTSDGIARERVGDAFSSVGLDVDFAPSGRGAFGHAFKDVRQKQYVGAISKQLSWERESSRSEALLLRWSEGAGKAKETRTVLRVTLSPLHTTQLGPNFEPLAVEFGTYRSALGSRELGLVSNALDQFRGRFHWHRMNVATSEVRRAVERLLSEASAVKISSSLYYVPPIGHDLAVSVERAIAMSKSGDLAVFPQFDSAMGVERTGKMVRDSILDEVAEVRQELQALREEGARETSIALRLATLSAIRDRAESCVAVLGSQVALIRQAVADAAAGVRESLEDDDGDIPTSNVA